MKIVDKITMINVLVRDMDKSKAFYMDVLGFEARPEITYGKDRWVWVTPPGGGTIIALGTAFPELKPGAILGLFLSTPNIEEAYKQIKSKGFQPNSEIMPYPPGGRYFSVNDPDGNFLAIVQS
jgi:predicted enzyme related to lactoylglutathione lyase